MPHSYVSCHMHYIFSTKNRLDSITPDVRGRLWSYMAGIARTNDIVPLAVGGSHDHVHLLVSLPSTLSTAKAIQLIKGGSSKWISETSPAHDQFAWQEGYGAFSVSVSGIRETTSYIRNQEKHHLGTTFEDEFLAILKKHGIDYDERHVWG
ncbi:MAG: IS200/IS605 family transposase [Planctomycetes bacterium]|nr:IS200/IS605 family transposase [Planctomycetota bacterium]